MPDLEAAVAHPARVVVDSTASTPVYLRPLEHGADFALHSATKFLGGHHDVLLGAVACRSPEHAEQLREFRGRSGIVAAPDPCWLLLALAEDAACTDGAAHAQRHRARRPASLASRGRGRPLPGVRRAALLRRRGRRGRAPRRDLAADDRERNEPGRCALGAGIAHALGRRPRSTRALAAQRRARGRRGALERPRPALAG